MDFFYEAEQKLKNLYYTAKKVQITNGKVVPYGNPYGKVVSDQLIYSDSNFDVCQTKNGNKDRQCNISEDGVRRDGHKLCKDLCCGGKYERKPVRLRRQCNCKFQWCCKVICDICTSGDHRYFCTA